MSTVVIVIFRAVLVSFVIVFWGVGSPAASAGTTPFASRATGPLALYGDVAPEIAVGQLLDFGEIIRLASFPGHKVTETLW